MQIDLVLEQLPSGGNENIVTAMDVLSRHLFPYSTSIEDANTVTRVINNIMTKHAYFPFLINSDNESVFVSQVIKEKAEMFRITLQLATKKQAQIIGLFGRTHASLKQALNVGTGGRRSVWQKYVNIAVSNYSTSFRASIGCETSRMFHGHKPYDFLDSKMGVRPQTTTTPNTQVPQDGSS